MTEVSEEVSALDPQTVEHIMKQIQDNQFSPSNLGPPEDVHTLERSPSLRIRRLSTGHMETKSGFLKKKKSVPSVVLTVRKVFAKGYVDSPLIRSWS